MSEIHRVEDDGTFTLVGEGYTSHVYVDSEGKPARLPDYYWEAFERIKRDE
jgi:acyl-CoA thioesterase FadM